MILKLRQQEPNTQSKTTFRIQAQAIVDLTIRWDFRSILDRLNFAISIEEQCSKKAYIPTFILLPWIMLHDEFYSHLYSIGRRAPSDYSHQYHRPH